MNDYKSLIVNKKSKSIMEVTLNQPDRHNALSPQMIEDLNICFDNLNKNKKTKIIILSSNGKSFCAGGDLEWMKSQISADRATRIRESFKIGINVK